MRLSAVSMKPDSFACRRLSVSQQSHLDAAKCSGHGPLAREDQLHFPSFKTEQKCIFITVTQWLALFEKRDVSSGIVFITH